MVVRSPSAPSSPVFIHSSRLGLVSLPEPDLGSLSREEELDRDTVRECLHALGRNLGLTLLERVPEFPAAGSAAGDTDGAFPDAAVRRSLEGLDGVWLHEGAPVACFIVESGFGGWEGARRLADLVALHPKLKAPLYAVTLPSLFDSLRAEVHRPAYGLAKKPLAERLRLLDWEKLSAELAQLGDRVRYLKPEFLEGLSEPVSAPQA